MIKMEHYGSEDILIAISTQKINDVNFSEDYHVVGYSFDEVENTKLWTGDFKLNKYGNIEIDGGNVLTKSYCNRKFKVTLNYDRKHNSNLDIPYEFMIFEDYGNDFIGFEGDFARKVFDWNTVWIPSTIAIDQYKILYIVSLYEFDSELGLDFQTICKIPDKIFEELWNKKINSKRPFYITFPSIFLMNLIENYVGFKDFHKNIEIYIRNDKNNYYVFNTEGYRYSIVK